MSTARIPGDSEAGREAQLAFKVQLTDCYIFYIKKGIEMENTARYSLAVLGLLIASMGSRGFASEGGVIVEDGLAARGNPRQA